MSNENKLDGTAEGIATWIAVPNSQGYWWHWDKNPDLRPFMYHVQVSKSGRPDRYFIDFPDSRWCDEVRGVWQKAIEPSTVVFPVEPAAPVVQNEVVYDAWGKAGRLVSQPTPDYKPCALRSNNGPGCVSIPCQCYPASHPTPVVVPEIDFVGADFAMADNAREVKAPVVVRPEDTRHSVQVTYRGTGATAVCACGWKSSESGPVTAGGFVHAMANEHLSAQPAPLPSDQIAWIKHNSWADGYAQAVADHKNSAALPVGQKETK